MTTKLNKMQLDDTIERLKDALPHGSGINGKWYIEYNRRANKFYASNYYEAMNDVGMYCHCYDFTVIYSYNGSDKFKPCEYCHATGKRSLSEFSQEVQSRLRKERTFEILSDDTMLCNVCNGKGKIAIPEFEFDRLNFHGQREYACCGYDLKNYLSDILTLD